MASRWSASGYPRRATGAVTSCVSTSKDCCALTPRPAHSSIRKPCRLAEHIREFCARWKVRPHGVADDAIFAKGGHSRGSISDEFRAAGVYFEPAKKAERIPGWQVMRRLLQDAGKPDVPGLYIARHCEYFWQTVPYLGRDPKRIEDVDFRSPDHAADAVRYGCLRARQRKYGGYP
jgi:hypothetical protein